LEIGNKGEGGEKGRGKVGCFFHGLMWQVTMAPLLIDRTRARCFSGYFRGIGLQGRLRFPERPRAPVNWAKAQAISSPRSPCLGESNVRSLPPERRAGNLGTLTEGTEGTEVARKDGEASR
jgi:hypothetical protein